MPIDQDPAVRLDKLRQRANTIGLHLTGAINQSGGLTSDCRYALCVPARVEPGAHVDLTIDEVESCIARWERESTG